MENLEIYNKVKEVPKNAQKEISNFEGLYFISSEGKVFNSKGKELIGGISDGYRYVDLYKNSIKHRKKIHRLVAQAFIPNPENKPFINHIDGNRQNNNVTNLEWCTNQENQIHALKYGLNNNYGANCWKSRKVNQIKDGVIIKTWGCISDVQRELKIHLSNVVKCCNSQRKTAGGYEWQYVSEVIK